MTNTTFLQTLSDDNSFAHRHNGPNANEQQRMLETIGVGSIDQLIAQTVPCFYSPISLQGGS